MLLKKSLPVLILGASPLIVPLIKEAKKLGFVTHVCSNIESDPGLNIADFSYLYSITDRVKLLQLCKKINPIGILTSASDIATLNVGFLNDSLNLSGITEKQVISVSNKGNFVLLQKKLNLPTPFSYIIRNEDDLERFKLNKIIYPVIMKPFFSSGSRGVKVVNQYEELVSHHSVCIENSQYEKGYVIQTFLKNYTEVGCECFIENGKVVFLETTIKFLNKFKVPIGHFVPGIIDDTIKNEIITQIKTIADYLEINNTPLNLDILIHKGKKPIIIDMSFRLGGNLLPEIIDATYQTLPYQRIISYATKQTPPVIKQFDKVRNTASIIFGVGEDCKMDEALKSKINLVFNQALLKEIKYDKKNDEFLQVFIQSNRRIGHVVFHPIDINDYKEKLHQVKQITLNF